MITQLKCIVDAGITTAGAVSYATGIPLSDIEELIAGITKPSAEQARALDALWSSYSDAVRLTNVAHMRTRIQ